MPKTHEQLSLDSHQEPLKIPLGNLFFRGAEPEEIQERTLERQNLLKAMGYYSVREKVIVISSRIKLSGEAEAVPVD